MPAAFFALDVHAHHRGGRGTNEALIAREDGQVEHYDPDVPLAITLEQLVAEDDWVACQLVLAAKTAGCKYCYAVISHATAVENFRRHDPVGISLR